MTTIDRVNVLATDELQIRGVVAIMVGGDRLSSMTGKLAYLLTFSGMGSVGPRLSGLTFRKGEGAAADTVH